MKDKVYAAQSAYEKKAGTQGGKRNARAAEIEREREELKGLSREKVTARMVRPLQTATSRAER